MSAAVNVPQQRLTAAERYRLADCETTIREGLGTFVEVGKALATIREGRLYREEFATFEDYCRERWGFGASRGRQLIGAADVAEMLATVTPGNTPATEKQARVLVPLNPVERATAWAKATQNGHQPTAEELSAAAFACLSPEKQLEVIEAERAAGREADAEADEGEADPADARRHTLDAIRSDLERAMRRARGLHDSLPFRLALKEALAELDRLA